MRKWASTLRAGYWRWLVAACGGGVCSCGAGSAGKTRVSHDYDAAVMPLVNSYQLLKLDGKNEQWSLSLKNKPGSVENIDSVGLVGHTILLHSFETYARDTLRMPSWFVIDSTIPVENQFESRALYVRYLATRKVTCKLVPIEDFIHKTGAVMGSK